MANNKMMNFLAIGAVVGLAVSMADKNTRESVIRNSKDAGTRIAYYKNNRKELAERAKQQAKKAQAIYSRIQEDTQYVTEKINQLKELAPPVMNLMSETKEAFAETKIAVDKVKEDVVAAVKEQPTSSADSTNQNNSSI